jgi:hypothetical protein
MNTITILINKKKLSYEGPAGYDECTSQQYVQLHRFRQRVTLDAHAHFLILRLVYDIPERYAQYFFDKAAMEILGVMDEEEQDYLTAQGVALLETCQWVFDGKLPANWLIKQVFVRNGSTVYGPADKLADLTFEDFMYAELYYSQRQFGKLMAVLFRLRHTQSKSRLLLNAEKIGHYAEGFGNMPTWTQEAVYFNYEGCRQYLATCFEHVFRKSKEKSDAENGTWLDVAIGMAGDDPRKFNDLKKENAYIVLKMLDNSLAQIAKLKENGPNS